MFKRDKLFAGSESEEFEVYPGDVRSPRGRRQSGPAQRHVAVHRLHSTQPPISNSTTAGRGGMSIRCIGDGRQCCAGGDTAAAQVPVTAGHPMCKCPHTGSAWDVAPRQC